MEREIKRNNQGRIISYSLSDSNDTYGVIELNDFVRKFENLSFFQIIPTDIEDVSQDVLLGSNINEPIIINTNGSTSVTPTVGNTAGNTAGNTGGGFITGGGISSAGNAGSSTQTNTSIGISSTQNQPGTSQPGSSDEFSGQLYYPIGYPGQAPGDFAFDSTGMRWEWDGQQWNNF